MVAPPFLVPDARNERRSSRHDLMGYSRTEFGDKNPLWLCPPCPSRDASLRAVCIKGAAVMAMPIRRATRALASLFI
jgi:hypothetical protein